MTRDEAATSTDLDQVRAAMRGDAGAIEALWIDHRRWVAAILLAHMPRDHEVEDLLQEVALTVVRTVHRLEQPEAWRSWLRTVAINAARTAARRRNVRLRLVRPADWPDAWPHAVEGADGDEDAPARLPATDLPPPDRCADESDRDVLDAVRALPEKYREPLLLKSVRGLSQRGIAQLLDLPETTVETRLARARRMLRERLARRANDDDRGDGDGVARAARPASDSVSGKAAP